MNLPYTLEKVVTNSDSRSFNENKWRKPPREMNQANYDDFYHDEKL